MKSESHNCDCMDYMRELPDKYFSLAVVDPPYGMPKDSTHGRGKLKSRILNNGGVNEWDTAPDKSYFEELFRISENQIIWGGNYFSLPGTRCFVIWDKEQPWENFSAFEYAWTSFSKPSMRYRERAVAQTGKIHPTQKSVDLYQFLLKRFTQQGDTIFDSHLGSGSSRIAADKMGFDFVATEIGIDYYNSQEKRWADYKSQMVLEF